MKIVLASVLKPADDTRMFHKMGQTLASAGHEIHICGFPGGVKGKHENIFLHSHKHFKRLDFYRLTVPWRILRRITAIKPGLLIITTHELLLIGVLAKIICNTKLIYDVQENYFRNIIALPSFPVLVRPMLAIFVRTKELLLSGFVDHFILAETVYARELPFIRNKFTILENKAKKPAHLKMRGRIGNNMKLLFSGTLAETTGVFIAIRLAAFLHQHDPGIRLTIIGYCSLPGTLKRIKEQIEATDFISLTGGDVLVPHEKILEAIENADAGIIAYIPNKATRDKVPTKLFEYLAHQLPVIITSHPPWTDRCATYNAGVTFDPDQIDAACILNELRRREFYTSSPSPEIYWESEEPKLLRAVKDTTVRV